MKYFLKVAIQHYAMGLIIPISIIWKLQSGLSLPEAVLTEAAVLLTTTFADLPAGLLAVKINNKRSLVLGALLHLIGIALLAAGSSFAVFMCAAIVTGLGWACVSGADEAYMHDDYVAEPAAYSRFFATSTIVDEVATVVGMLTSSLLLYLGMGLRAVFIGASVVLAVHLVYTALILPSSKQTVADTRGKPVALPGLGIFKNSKFLVMLPLMLAIAIMYEAGRPLWQPHLQEIGISLTTFGVLFALLKLASIAGSVAARGSMFGRLQLAGICLAMLSSLLLFGVDIKIVSIVALCVFLFTENYFRVYASTLLNRHIVSHRAAILSMGSVVRNAAGAGILVAAGFIAADSIVLALAFVVAIKVPAVAYLLYKYAQPSASLH